MANKTFIPNWYIDKKIKGRNKKNKICIIVISTINIILLSFILSNSNKIQNIERKVVSEKSNIIIEEAFKPNTIVIEKHKELSSFFQANNLSYKNMTITKDNLEIDIEVKDYEEYIYVIRCIENQYSIKQLVPNTKSEGKFDFKVILGV
ncbi:hypothetical protein LGK97_01640 [Clostridium sp. CS001]|uniref:hypothetical protein n=1 Tax=Clostridium sp. CS001 TaxID=2880648 RepID=UPI001CF556A3|nr:hypothetical protein [Clostridium sp. CS001]MCB2288470.1 hypothetical protein [Clostridium sp. CS001]